MYAIIQPIEPFDSTLGTTIKFVWNGNRIKSVKCIIKDNHTGDVIPTTEIETMKSEFEVPPNILVNGKVYVAYIIVTDINGTQSSIQNVGTLFYCFSTPLFHLTVSDGDIISASSVPVELIYEQAENEDLDEYTIRLLSYSKTPIQTFGPIYGYDISNRTYVITGLENATQYYIQVTGKTKHGMVLPTQEVLFTVAYSQALVFTTLELNNRAESGAIEIRSNIISTEGEPEHEVIYIDGKYADLRDNSVTFDVGYEATGDFTKIFVFYEPNINQKIVTFSDQEKKTVVDIYYREGSYVDSAGKQAYFELQSSYGTHVTITYVRMSNFINIPNIDQMFSLCVNRIKNLYDLKVYLVNK